MRSSVAAVVGAIGSFGLMLYASRNQQSLLLTALFTGWVLAPFAALMCASVAAKNWSIPIQRTLCGVSFLITVGSLAIYGAHVLGVFKAKIGFLYLVVPAATWLVAAGGFAWTALKSR
jgi:hypothetical protein